MDRLPFFFASDCACGLKTSEITPDCCTPLLVTKYECVNLKPTWDLQPWLPIPWQGGRRMVEIPHIVGHAAILNPNQATRLQLYSSLLPPVMGELQPCEQGGAEQNNCAAVTELALSKTANTMRQGEWDSLFGLSLFCSGLWSVRWLLSSACTYTLSCEWREG